MYNVLSEKPPWWYKPVSILSRITNNIPLSLLTTHTRNQFHNRLIPLSLSFADNNNIETAAGKQLPRSYTWPSAGQMGNSRRQFDSRTVWSYGRRPLYGVWNIGRPRTTANGERRRCGCLLRQNVACFPCRRLLFVQFVAVWWQAGRLSGRSHRRTKWHWIFDRRPQERRHQYQISGPLQTNEPINDRAIPTDKEVSIIAAIGPLNARQEANSHPHDGLHVNSEDIQINFSSKVCSNTNDLMMSEHHSENEYFKFFYRMTIHVQCLCIRFVMRTRQSHGHRW